jgi:hypothetical protein
MLSLMYSFFAVIHVQFICLNKKEPPLFIASNSSNILIAFEIRGGFTTISQHKKSADFDSFVKELYAGSAAVLRFDRTFVGYGAYI